MRNVDIVRYAISSQSSYLARTAEDWAFRDETYDFVRTENPEYVKKNLEGDSLKCLDANLMLFINDSGGLVYSRYRNQTYEGPYFPASELLIKLTEYSLPVQNRTDRKSGVILFEGKPMNVVSFPVLKNTQEGPVQGTFILGKNLDGTFIKSVEEVSSSALIFQNVDGKIPPEFKEKFGDALNEVAIDFPDGEKARGYFVLKDTGGQPTFMCRVEFPRDSYAQILKNLDFTYLFILMTWLFMGAGTAFTHCRLFVSRLKEIDSFVGNVKKDKDLSGRLDVKGNDELYRLGQGINAMLDNIVRAEKEVKAQEMEKKYILDSINEIIVFVSPDFKVIWANRVALKLMNMKLEEARTYCQLDGSGIWKNVYEVLQLEKVLENGVKKTGEVTTRDGSVWYIQAIPVKNEDGKIVGILETGLDITSSKKAEKLFYEKEAAEASNRTKGEFLANMSHELRTPLNSILGFSELLQEGIYGPLNEKQMKHIGDIQTSGRHLLNMINDLLDFSKIEAGKMELNYEEFPLYEIIEEVLNLLFPIAEKNHIKLELIIEADFGNIRADKDKFVQILENLLSNAIKFSPDGSCVRVHVSRREGRVKIEVKDRGIGIAKEDRHKLFKPFSQIDSSISKKYGGTGLGLALIKQLVQLHNGYVWFRSEEGKGSIFGFSIPVEGREK